MAQNEYAVRLEHVTKTFGPVVANKDVSLGVRRGEILARQDHADEHDRRYLLPR